MRVFTEKEISENYNPKIIDNKLQSKFILLYEFITFLSDRYTEEEIRTIIDNLEFKYKRVINHGNKNN